MHLVGRDKMRKRKCIKEHYIPYFDTICQVGRDFKLFDYSVTTHYCYLCNRVRVERKIYFHKPKFLQKNNKDIPF